jgi:hypothetical protein
MSTRLRFSDWFLHSQRNRLSITNSK